MTSKLVSTNNLSKWYGQIMGLNQFTADFPKGLTGVVGPNGAGKSTLLKLITGQLHKGMGEIEVLGQNPWNNTNLMASIGYCPEHDSFYEWMTGFEFVHSLLCIGGESRSRARTMALDAIQLVGLSLDQDRQIRGYSKGMRQRIKVAQAIATKPPLLIFDEPLSGTDPVVRHELIQLFKELAKQNTDIIISSHVLHEIERTTDYVILINEGRLLADGHVGDIRNLIDAHPHCVVLRGQMLRKIAKLIIDQDYVNSIKFEPNGDLLLETREPDRFYAEFPKFVIDNEVKIDEMYSPDDNLESVFRYLLHR